MKIQFPAFVHVRAFMNGRRMLVAATAVVLISFYLLLTLSTASQKSAYFDETAHIMSGYFMLAHSDYRLGTSNMILGQKAAALPLIFSKANPPDPGIVKEVFNRPNITGKEIFSLGFIFLNSSGNDSHKLLFLGRIMMALFGLATALVVFFWSKKIFGTAGGLISLSFLATCPVFISLSGIIGADIAATALFVVLAWAYWTLLHKVTPFTVATFGVLAALLLMTKLSSLLFGPVSLLLLLLRIIAGRPLEIGWGWKPSKQISSPRQTVPVLAGALITASIIVFAVIWAGYGFRYSANPQGTDGATLNWDGALRNQETQAVSTVSMQENNKSLSADFIVTLKNYHALPEAFLFDLANLSSLRESRPAFFMGETRTNGWISYFPVAFLAKTGLPMILALIMAAASWAWFYFRRGKNPLLEIPWKTYECLPILVFVAVYMFFTMASGVNLGCRYILPIYPFVYILLGGLVFIFRQAVLWPKILLGILIAASFGTAVANHPNHLAYISPALGGQEQGYRIFADSSLEWGQELPSTKKWLDRHAEELRGKNIYLSYFGSGSPESEGISVNRLPGYFDPLQIVPGSCTFRERLRPGIYLVSGTMLQPVYYSRQIGTDPEIDFSGAWNRQHEEQYQELRKRAEQFFIVSEQAVSARNPEILLNWMKKERPADVPEAQSEEYWKRFLAIYDVARFAKLVSYLRDQKPDGNINYSIYIFNLDENRLKLALE